MPVALTASLLIVGFVTAPLSPGSALDYCGSTSQYTGGCPSVDAGLTDEEAVIHGTQPGSGSSGGGGGGGTIVTVPCFGPGCDIPGTVDRSTFTVINPTLNDLIGFRPSPGVDHMEPNGWFVVGLDANFYATGGSSLRTGTLLGYPASVRFTPIRWTWSYGDGSSATRSTPGATWAAQGIREFEATPTSHVYERAGTYVIDLTIGYRAEYSFDGSSFATIPGTLWVPANRLVATVGSAKTVLVERDCRRNPSGPGC